MVNNNVEGNSFLLKYISKGYISLLQGQFISLLIAGTGIFATFLSTAKPNANFPSFLNFLNYFLLSSYLLRSNGSGAKKCYNGFTILFNTIWKNIIGYLYNNNNNKNNNSNNDINIDSNNNSDSNNSNIDNCGNNIDSNNNSNSNNNNVCNIHTTNSSENLINNVKNEIVISSNCNNENNQSPYFYGLYILASFLDVEANFLVLQAYNYTSITSIMLLDCFTIPCSMVISYYFLKCRYTSKHVIGTLICFMGIVCIIYSDTILDDTDNNKDSDNDQSNKNALIGDAFCLASAFLYACSNVLQEHLVKFDDREKYIGIVGMIAALLSICQLSFTDLSNMRKSTNLSKINIIMSIFGFVMCQFLVYVNTSAFLQFGDATLLNLGILTSDVYAVIFSYFLKGYLVNWVYFVSFGLVLIGLVIYHSELPPIRLGSIPPSFKILIDNSYESHLDSVLIDNNSNIDNSNIIDNNNIDNYNPLNTEEQLP
jgi:solute carrier family 35 protein F1/2